MSSKKKQETRVSLDSSILTVNKESTTVSSRSRTEVEKPMIKTRKPPPVLPKLLPYTPPDALMFPLFNAIQRRAWMRARRLSHELILCDPLRQNYRDLYYQINQIITLIERRVQPKAAIISRVATASRATTASNSNTDEETIIQR
ncbi:unnamed protein product [Rotaria sordida]|uniref:Uncharacterized protein n=1 Tax=Rotaria sordida TaxID=392033 RepID=A0A818RY45_9BILA|nr:unnamed protein product [Rotaria sordida]CAF3661114.1 unnamed protein product [Rotaria sordida]